jgi:hypothetical protein
MLQTTAAAAAGAGRSSIKFISIYCVLMRAAIAIIIGFMFVFGCLSSVGGEDYALDYMKNLNRTPLSPEEIEKCNIGSCWCLVCKNGTNIFGPMNNLVGGYCYFEKECDQDRAKNISSTQLTPDLSIHHFMIGQGPTFSDFSAANPYCSHRLGMAVQWLTATNETPYTLPDASRAMCFLSKDVMPVYVLHSKGENINITQTREIARILGEGGRDVFLGRLSSGPVGPVIVTTEIDYNLSNASQVAEQVRAINEGCHNDRENNKINCFVAVAPKINDFKALDAVMKEVGDEVDLVAYGINGNYVHSCRGIDIKRQALNFSSYILYNWSKPSIIPYVMFDTQGTDVDKSCEWNERRMLDAYSAFWPEGIISLQKVGVIGIAPYSFNSTTLGAVNPLGCADCGVGKNNQRLGAWYNWCQRYTNITRKAPGATTSHPSGSTPIIFPNESGGYCGFGSNLDYILREIQYGDAASTKDFMREVTPELKEPTETYFTCDKCIAVNASAKPPFEFLEWKTDLSAACEIYPEIDQWASLRNLDPMLVRAFIFAESQFQPCAAARVCSAEYKRQIGVTETDSKGCFQPGLVDDECYNFPAYDEMYDPAGTCRFQNAPSAARPNWRWCAVGMMQVVQPPYTFWPDAELPEGLQSGVDNPHVEIYEKSGFEGHRAINFDVARSCTPDGKYNPFNVSHSVCLGTYAMEAAMKDAEDWVMANRGNSPETGYLNWGPEDYEKDQVFIAYVAGQMYTGFWYSTNRSCSHPTCPCYPEGYQGPKITNGECWAMGFQEASRVDEEYCDTENWMNYPECEGRGKPLQKTPEFCYGYDDFVKYVRDCEVPYLHRQADPGGNRMSMYYWLINNCENSFCPEGKRLIVEMCKPDKETGEYNKDLCIGPNMPKILGEGGTGTPYIPGQPVAP